MLFEDVKLGIITRESKGVHTVLEPDSRGT